MTRSASANVCVVDSGFASPSAQLGWFCVSSWYPYMLYAAAEVVVVVGFSGLTCVFFFFEDFGEEF